MALKTGNEMRRWGHDVLNRYLKSALGHKLVLPEPAELTRQRENFLAQFGPDALMSMSVPDLLERLPYNVANEQPMDYWLEFKNDDQHDRRLFGSIMGGSAAKYGAWQEKQTGQWRGTKLGVGGIVDISEDAALRTLEERRREILAAVEAIGPFDGLAVEDIDRSKFQKAVQSAAPRWYGSAWLHKYLHLNYPQLITWTATKAWSEAELYLMGLVPWGRGLYGQDLQIIAFWNSMPALSELPVFVRYRVASGIQPRDHWALTVSDDQAPTAKMLAGGYLALGPAKATDLGKVMALNKRREIREGIATAFRDTGLGEQLPAALDLVELAYGLEEGAIVALFEGPSTVIAIGEVSGPYRYDVGEDRPHRIPVRWFSSESFEASDTVPEEGPRLTKLRPSHGAVADLGGALLVAGHGPWPGFGAFAKIRFAPPTFPPTPEPPQLEGVARDVIGMLERKRQVILYGPPGTGKTYHATRIALELVARRDFKCVSAELTDRQRDAIHGLSDSSPKVATCTFHPMYSYEDFIEGYRPYGEGFRLEAGIFKRMVEAALEQPAGTFVLVIDEINRGNIPKIFGELITLIEVSKRATMQVVLPLSKKSFTVPDNLYLIGTMNTADRSILLLDTALRRRFAFKELMPEPQLLQSGAIGDVSLATWLRALNRRIVEQLGRDGRNLQVGHAYLMPGGKPAATLSRIGEIVRDELWPLLQEYCYEDPNKLAGILAANRGGIYDRDAADLRFALFEPGREEELMAALLAILTPEDKRQDADLGEDLPEDQEPDELDETEDEEA